MEQQKQYRYRLSNIEMPLKFVGFPTNGVPIPKPETLSFNYVLDVQIDSQNKIAFGVTNVTIFPPEDRTMKLADFQVVCSFQFEDFDEVFVKGEADIFTMPVEVEISLKSICYSTARGVLFSELRGTYLHFAFLPVDNIGLKILEDRKARDAAKIEKTN